MFAINAFPQACPLFKRRLAADDSVGGYTADPAGSSHTIVVHAYTVRGWGHELLSLRPDLDDLGCALGVGSPIRICKVGCNPCNHG